jgi:phage-related protein
MVQGWLMTEKICLVFFMTEAGGEPVREWLKGLPKAHRLLIGQDLATAQYGWPVGMPLCRPLRQGLFELRTTLPDNTEARVYICQSGDVLVALHSVIKKTQRADPDDINLARKRLNQIEQERKKQEKRRGR